MATEEEEIQVACRLPKSVIRKMDREIDRLEKERPESRVTRASLLRALACKFVEDLDDADSTGPKRKVG